MFLGGTNLKLDAKGRLAVPSKHREALASGDGQFVITAHPHGCLIVLPMSAWEPIRDQVLRAPSLDPDSAQWKRLIIGYAQEEPLDSAGRVLIGSELREYAELDKDVRLVGQGSHFELWSYEKWRFQEQGFKTLTRDKLPPGFENLAF